MLRRSSFVYLVLYVNILKFASTTLEEDTIQSKENKSIWVSRGSVFNKHNVGIIFSLNGQGNLSSAQLNLLRENIVNNFCKVVLLLHDDTPAGLRIFYSELEFLKVIKKDLEISVVILPTVEVNILNRTRSVPSGILDLPDYYFFDFASDSSVVNSRMDYLQAMQLNYKWVYAFNVTKCRSLLAANLPDYLDVLGRNLRILKPGSILFYFEEADKSTKREANIIFQRRVVAMKKCQQLVRRWRLGKGIKVNFMMLHYATSPKFYDDKWEMLNYITYCEKLSLWAADTNTTVILNNAADSLRYFGKQLPPTMEVGWWKFSNGGWSSKIDEIVFRAPGTNATHSSPTINTTAHPPFSHSPPIKINSLLPPVNSSRVNANLYFVLIVILVLVTVIALIQFVVYLTQRLRPKVILTKNEIDDFLHGMTCAKESRPQIRIIHPAYTMPYPGSRFEIGMDSVTFNDHVPPLGTGRFGIVCQGRIGPQIDQAMHVAIKLLNPKKVCKFAVKDFLSEIKILSYIERHDHIVNFIGANTENIQFGKVLVFLELCELGSLQKHLLQIKDSLENDDSRKITASGHTISMEDEGISRYVHMMAMNKIQIDPITSRNLLRWSHEICTAMAYIASVNLVHADLSTKNVLLNGNLQVKICDFGLSRKTGYYSQRTINQKEPLNWRWMAPEALKYKYFSEKTDVWAYGVTLWEIFSLGKQPFSGFEWTDAFGDLLEDGYQLAEPEHNDLNMYPIMRKCWIPEAPDRPTFSELLPDLLENITTFCKANNTIHVEE